MLHLSIYFVLGTTFIYIDMDTYQGFLLSDLTEVDIQEFGDLQDQVRSTEFEDGLQLVFRDKFRRTILGDSNLHHIMKQRRKRRIKLNLPRVGGGVYPTVIWNLILLFARTGVKVTVDEKQIAFHRFHPVRFDWYQHVDQSRTLFGYVRDHLYKPDAEKLELFRDDAGEKGFTINPIYLPRCTPVFVYQSIRCKISGYFAATGVVYLKDIPRDQFLKINLDDPRTWKYTTPAPITLATLGVWKKNFHRGYSEYNQRYGIFTSYCMNEGMSMSDLSVAPDCRYSNGTYYISRSRSRLSIQSISIFMARFNGYNLHLSVFKSQYGVPVTTSIFYPSCMNTLHQVSFIRTTNNTMESLRSQLSIPVNAVRAMEDKAKEYHEPHCKECGISRMCTNFCCGPVISEQQLQMEIEVCLIAHYAPRYLTSTTKRGYFGFYHHLRQNFPDLQVFSGVYVDEYWLYHEIPRGIVPEVGKNAYFPCLVEFDSAFWEDANSEDVTLIGGKRKFEADCYSSDGGDCCFEDAEASDADEEPPRKKQKIEDKIIYEESDEDDDDVDLDPPDDIV